MHWLADPGQFGWLVGVATGVFAAAIMTILIATAPRLGPTRPAGSPSGNSLLQHLLGVPLIAVWLVGGWYVGVNDPVSYGIILAVAVALSVGVVVLLAMFTAANQIGTRSVR